MPVAALQHARKMRLNLSRRLYPKTNTELLAAAYRRYSKTQDNYKNPYETNQKVRSALTNANKMPQVSWFRYFAKVHDLLV